jgi:hypothetical protein
VRIENRLIGGDGLADGVRVLRRGGGEQRRQVRLAMIDSASVRTLETPRSRRPTSTHVEASAARALLRRKMSPERAE